MEASHIEGEIPSRLIMRQGIILFLVSEAFLFGSLFWTYYYLKAKASVWPPEGVSLDTGYAVIMTVLLVVSSGTIMLAVRAIRKGNERGLAYGIVATILLGSAFLGMTVWEWLHESFLPWTHAYGSTFFTLTGFHALHVFAGVILMSALLTRTLRHRFSARGFVGVEVGSLYWHFVDIVWLAVFSTLFIIR